MLKKGVKKWMGYWKEANEQRNVEFQARMTEIMKRTSGKDRKTTYSVKEKKEHWEITKMISRTILHKERLIPIVNSRKKKELIWIQQPLMEIIGGKKEVGNYPSVIAVRLLKNQQHDIKFFPAIFKNTTLQLHPSHCYAAFYIQNRASQSQKEKIKLDWPFCFELFHLEKTALKNIHAAKQEVRNGLNEFKANSIISNWEETPNQIWVAPIRDKKIQLNLGQTFSEPRANV